MLRTKTADRVVCIAVVFMLAAAVCLWGLVEPVQGDGSHEIGYESRLFDTSRVHTIEITAENWDEIIANAAEEKYRECSIVIDGENLGRVGIRAKGNTSLSSVASLGSTRYSFKVEFNHYVKGKKYHGLDKLSLNNLIQDATMMKDYLAYCLMGRMGVPSPLCSYVQITVNGEPWGLYLAVEGVEDAFRDRNGMTKGELYKPDSISFGGGRGNGREFDIEKFREQEESGASFSPPEGVMQQPGGGFNFGMGSNDVKLIYSGDDPANYSNIFDNAKTKISNKDKERLIASLKKLNEGEDLDSVVNKDEVITYLAVHNFLCNDDSYTGMMVHNYYLYERKGKLSIIPWDYNLGFGGFSASTDATSTVNSPIDDPVSGGTTDSRPLISWIFSDEESLAAYHDTYSRFLSECVESGWLEEEITRVQEMIKPYAESDPTAFFTPEAHEKAVSTLKTFCAKRAESVRGQLEGTVPSTEQGQRENKDALIDASEISTADMGKMDNDHNPGGGNGNMPSMPDFPNGNFTPPDFQNGEDFDPSQFQNGNFTPPDSPDGKTFDPSQFQNGNFTPPSGPADAVPATSPESTEKPAEAEASAAPEQAPKAKNSTGQRIRDGLCIFLLLAAILVIRRLRGHNE